MATNSSQTMGCFTQQLHAGELFKHELVCIYINEQCFVLVNLLLKHKLVYVYVNNYVARVLEYNIKFYS